MSMRMSMRLDMGMRILIEDARPSPPAGKSVARSATDEGLRRKALVGDEALTSQPLTPDPSPAGGEERKVSAHV